MTERFLNDEITAQLKDLFSQMKNPVEMMVFVDSKEKCPYCEETRQLMEEVSEISDWVSVQVIDVKKQLELAEEFEIDKTPTTVIISKEKDGSVVDYGIRFSGIPAGHEFSSLIQALLMVSKRNSDLDKETRQFLKGLEQDVHLQVFVTPSCPYCPQSVILAHRMAFESEHVKAEMVEASEFPELASHYGISGVPHTIINAGQGELIGAVPEKMLMDKIKESLGLE